MNWELALAVVGGIFTIGTTWGMNQRTIKKMERELEKHERSLTVAFDKIAQAREEILGRIHDLSSVYVTNERFHEALQVIRESQRDMKDDIKRILQLVSRTGADS